MASLPSSSSSDPALASPIPPPPPSGTGLVGQLTVSQYRTLQRFWREFLASLGPSTTEQASGAHSDHALLSADTLDKHDHDPASWDALASQELQDDKLLSQAWVKTLDRRREVDECEEEEEKQAESRQAIHYVFQRFGPRRVLESFQALVMMDDPDVIVLKFLRARKWKVLAALSMLLKCVEWRIDSRIDERLILKGEEGLGDQDPDLITQIRQGKAFAQGTDLQGHPVVYITVKLHRANEQSLQTMEDFTVYCMEAVRLLLTPPKVEKATIVFDMSGFGLANMDWKSLPFMIKCLEAYYPESLHVLLVHNPPWVFHGVWKAIAPMLDPTVRAKIKMTKTQAELESHIDPKHLLKSLGGKNDWTWKYEPVVPGENQPINDVQTRQKEVERHQKLFEIYCEVTRQWCQRSDNDSLKLFHYPDPNGINRTTQKDKVIKEDPSVSSQLRKYMAWQLRAHFFTLDPYVRARTIYHRKGNVIGNGLVTFEYPKVRMQHESSTASQSNPRQSEKPDADGSTFVDHWEVLGYDECKEELMIKIEKLKTKFHSQSIKFPAMT